MARRLIGVGLASCLFGAVFLDPSMWWGVGALGYLTVGLLDGLVVAIHQRILTRALMIDELFEDTLTAGIEEYEAMEEGYE